MGHNREEIPVQKMNHAARAGLLGGTVSRPQLQTVGLEVEGWGDMSRVLTSADCKVSRTHGNIECDVGRNQGELITHPCTSLAAAVAALRELSAEFPLRFQVFRPNDVPGRLEWLRGEKLEVNAMYLALADMCKAYDLDFGRVVKMTEIAGLHVNIDGQVDWMSPKGLFVINMLNHLLPFWAAQIHREISDGKGHNLAWGGYALPGFFDQYGVWLPTRMAFKSAFEKLPRLVGEAADGTLVPWPGERQEFGNRRDHCRWWKSARPKPKPDGGWYLEVRGLPSMGIDLIEVWAGETIVLVELLLAWFDGHQQGNPVKRMADAKVAFQMVHNHWRFLPAAVPTREEWETARAS